MLFYATGDRWYHATASEGGVWHDFFLRSTTATFVYLTHSPVVSQFENAILRPKGRMMAGTRAPPPKWGVMRSQKEVLCGTLFSARMTGRSRPHLSLREGSEQPPPRSGAESPGDGPMKSRVRQ